MTTSPRPPLPSLRVQLPLSTVDDVIKTLGIDFSPGGWFFRSKKLLAIGSQLHLSLRLADGSLLIGGECSVVWVRPADPDEPRLRPGMGLRFEKLDCENSRRNFGRILWSNEAYRQTLLDAQAEGFTLLPLLPAAPQWGSADQAEATAPG